MRAVICLMLGLVVGCSKPIPTMASRLPETTKQEANSVANTLANIQEMLAKPHEESIGKTIKAKVYFLGHSEPGPSFILEPLVASVVKPKDLRSQAQKSINTTTIHTENVSSIKLPALEINEPVVIEIKIKNILGASIYGELLAISK